MSYYKTLGAVFVIMMASVVVQGSNLFNDIFFVFAYAIMGIVLVLGTKLKDNSTTAFLLGIILILSIGFLSTTVLAEFFTSTPSIPIFFKMTIVFSLDGCALFFLHYGRVLRKLENESHGLGQLQTYKEQVLE
ncbi:MAG: hypothetical protein KAS32_09575 [Candidatus Peribacteraceae bacterium]|nr:hypothetical protein [Candidatus Peribacteraceae bacterium]